MTQPPEDTLNKTPTFEEIEYAREVLKKTVSPLYEKVIQRVEVDGGLEISCRLGNWKVFGEDRERVEQEARHYFWVHYDEGEYDVFR